MVFIPTPTPTEESILTNENFIYKTLRQNASFINFFAVIIHNVKMYRECSLLCVYFLILRFLFIIVWKWRKSLEYCYFYDIVLLKFKSVQVNHFLCMTFNVLHRPLHLALFDFSWSREYLCLYTVKLPFSSEHNKSPFKRCNIPVDCFSLTYNVSASVLVWKDIFLSKFYNKILVQITFSIYSFLF